MNANNESDVTNKVMGKDKGIIQNCNYSNDYYGDQMCSSVMGAANA